VAYISDEAIAQWRGRWQKYPGLTDRIKEIISHDATIGNRNTIGNWQESVRQLLRSASANDFEMLTEKDSYLDLRGIDFRNSDLCNADLSSIYFDGAMFDNTRLEGAILRYSYFRHASFSEANMKSTCLDLAHFENADLYQAHLEGALLEETSFEKANLMEAHFEDAEIYNSNFTGASLQEAHLEGAWFSRNKFDKDTIFERNSFLPTLSRLIFRNTAHPQVLTRSNDKPVLSRWYKLFRLLKNRWFYTGFVDFKYEDADLTLAADLKRYIEDQRFVERFRRNSPTAYWIWNLTTACGWSTIRLMFWAILVIIGFSLLYTNFKLVSPPDLATPITQALVPSIGPAIPPFQPVEPNESVGVNRAMQWFYISFDIFTNLGIRIHTKPASNWGVIAMFIETILGWMTLGLAITVFANKYARRS